MIKTALFNLSKNKRWLSFIIYFIIAQTILLFSALVFEFLISEFDIKSGFETEVLFKTNQEKYIMVLIYAPLFETLVFNFLINEIINKFLNFFITILISSAIFASIHFYSPYYVIFAFVGGLVFNTIYFYSKNNWSVYFAFFATWLLHLNHNLIGVLLNK